MKYGAFKYGGFLYGIWRGVGVYVRAAIARVVQAAAGTYDNVRTHADVCRVVEIEIATGPGIDITGDFMPSIEVEL